MAKVPAAVTLTTFGEPRVAFAVMRSVQMVALVCSIEIKAPLATTKSMPAPLAKVAQSSASLPVTVKVTSFEAEVALAAAIVELGAAVSIGAVAVAASRLKLPAKSESEPAATAIVVEPVKFTDGVKVAEKLVPLPVKFEMLPLVEVTSELVNDPDAAGLLRLKFIVLVCPEMIVPICKEITSEIET